MNTEAIIANNIVIRKDEHEDIATSLQYVSKYLGDRILKNYMVFMDILALMLITNLWDSAKKC